MATENSDTGPDLQEEGDLPPTPFPDTVVYVWYSLLEAAIAATAMIFAIGILEGGEIIPDVLPVMTTGVATFVVVFLVLTWLRLRT